MSFIYKRYSSEYKEQVIELMNYLWNFNKELWKPYFEWKFEANPYIDEPLAFIALDGEKVVAFRGYMVIPFQIYDKKYLCAVLADTVTHADYQRKGLFSRVTKYSIQEILKDGRYLISLNSSSGGKTLNGYLKLGWKPLCEREQLFRFTIGGIMNKLLHRQPPNTYIKSSYTGRTLVLSDKCNVKDMCGIPFIYDHLSHCREERFYAWRFQNPRDKYKFAYNYDTQGNLVAYLVLFKIAEGKWDLIDFNALDKVELKYLLNWVCNSLKPLFIGLWTVGKENIIYRNYSDFGFVALNKVLRHMKKFQKPPFLVREFSDEKHEVVADAKNWDLYKLVADEI